MAIIDISVPVSEDLPIWPGSPAIQMFRQFDMDQGDGANDTTIQFSVHTGTHVDAPLHFLAQGQSVDQLSLEVLMGTTYVADVGDVAAITPEVLAALPIPVGSTRLLLKTRNSQLWLSPHPFERNFVALTAEAAQWVVDQGIRLVGIDYLSVQRFEDGPATHEILLGAEVVIIEGLNLNAVTPGEYELICLPVKLKGIEGAPARVVLRELT